MGKKSKNGTNMSLREFHSQANAAAPRPSLLASGVGARPQSSSAWSANEPTPASDSAEVSSAKTPAALAPHPAAVKAAMEAPEDDPEDEACLICTDPISWFAVGTSLPNVVFTRDHQKPFSDYDLRAMRVDKKLSIFFETPEVYDDVMILLRFNCPDPNCDVACPDGWPELKRHVQHEHGGFLCANPTPADGSASSQPSATSSPPAQASAAAQPPQPAREAWPALSAGRSASGAPDRQVPISGDPAIVAKLNELIKSDTGLLRFKNAAAAFRSSRTSAREFLDAFMDLVLQDDNLAGRPRKIIQTEAGKLWNRLAQSLSEAGADEPSAFAKAKKKAPESRIGKKEEMIRAWSDYRATSAPEENFGSQPATYASQATRPDPLGLRPDPPAVGAARSSSAAARVLVIKSNASKQRQHSAAWSSMASGRSYVPPSALRAAPVDPPRPANPPSLFVDAPPPSATAAVYEPAPSVSVAPAPPPPRAAPSARGKVPSNRSAAEFPSLPTRQNPPRLAQKASAWAGSASGSGSGGSGGGGGGGGGGEPNQLSLAGDGKKKKGKTVLMYVG
ncbi:hypothetical protein HK405_007930 [Cladochytrium tenue]|nr:hypothetical protein HK405_007930 [Cladochytrium tenue]